MTDTEDNPTTTESLVNSNPPVDKEDDPTTTESVVNSNPPVDKEDIISPPTPVTLNTTSPSSPSSLPSKVSPDSPRNCKIASPQKSEKKAFADHPDGFHANVEKIINGHNENNKDTESLINKKLLPGEEIMESFNVMLPDGMWPQWQIILICIITCGLALFYFLYKAFLRMLYRNKLITPKSVGFKRAVMIVTSLGRVMLWEVEAVQQKASNMVNYQTSVDPLSLFQSGLKAFIDCFKAITMNYSLIGLTNTCAPPMTYKVSTMFAVYHLRDLRQLSLLSVSAAPLGCCLCCPYFTSQIAMCFTGSTENDLVGFDMAPGIETVEYWSDTVNQYLNGASVDDDDSGVYGNKASVIYIEIETNKFDTVHTNSAEKILEELGNVITQILAHNKTIKQVFYGEAIDDGIMTTKTDAVIVGNSGKVTIPNVYFPLVAGEHILAVHGQLFRAKFYEWIYTILTMGIYYFMYIRPKRFNRTAFIVTSHRIAEVIINHRAGQVPSHGANYGFAARSFFPREVLQHGFMARSKNRVTGGIVTDFGGLKMTFDMFGRRDTFDAFLKFFGFFSKNDSFPKYDVEKPTDKVTLTGVEQKILPLVKGEYLVGRIQGQNQWRPLPLCEYVCNSSICPYVIFPWIPWLLCCTLRPKRSYSAIIVTNRAAYFLSTITNYTCECASDKDSFTLTYAPLQEFVGVQTSIDSAGKEWCARRCWHNICCCQLCKAILPLVKHQWTVRGAISDGVYVDVNGGPAAFAPIQSFDDFDMVTAKIQRAIYNATPTPYALEMHMKGDEKV